jgi:SnoaL-like domain
MQSPSEMIQATLYRFAWGYDMGDLGDIDQCFTSDARCEFRDTGLKVGRESIVAEFRRRRAAYAGNVVPWHVITNVFVTDLDEQSAHVRSWFTFFLQEEQGVQRFSNFGWYDDLFAREDGSWRIAERRILSPQAR